MDKSLRSIRPLSRDSLRGLEAGEPGEPPTFEWVNPLDLFVEDEYQRTIGENGIRLIRRIYSSFRWARFKPPVCVRLDEVDGVLVCIDGQHTATAAACHGGIDKIPVMIVSIADAGERAAAFVGHNTDRVALTSLAIFKGQVASGDEVSLRAEEACRAAGAEILGRAINRHSAETAGATVAVGTLKKIVKMHGAPFLTRVMRVLVQAGRAPIKSDEIAAVAVIFARVGAVPDLDERLLGVVRSRSAESWRAIALGTDHRGPLAGMLAAAWCRELDVRLDAPARSPSWGGARAVAALTRPSAPPQPSPPVARPAVPAPKAPAQAKKPAGEVRVPKAPPPRPTPRPPELAHLPAGTIMDKGMFRANGVEIDLRTRELRHRGRAVVLTDPGVRLLAALARPMPALVITGRLVPRVFPGCLPSDGPGLLRDLVERVNPLLRGALLEIKTIPKMGHALADLGG